MQDKIYDCIVLGTGAAGISAALTLKSLKIDFLLLGEKQLSNKVRAAENIKNYPGLARVSGEGLAAAFLSQLETEGIEITPARALGVYDLGDRFGVLCGGKDYFARTVILASGVEAVKPIGGESELLGKGVSYCATCDGFLYGGKTVAAVITSKDFEDEVELLASYASKVYVFALYKNPSFKAENIVLKNAIPLHICRNERGLNVQFEGGKVEVDGVFCLRSSIAPEMLAHGLACEDGHVAVDRKMATNIAGLFAAGDCTGRPYQYAKAAGEGNIAAHSVREFLKKA